MVMKMSESSDNRDRVFETESDQLAAAYSTFGKSCAVDEIENGVMHFPSGVLNMWNSLDPRFTEVMVRDCYGPLFDVAVNCSRLPAHGSPTRYSESHVFILGTEGTGKSMARMYFAHRLLKMARELHRDIYLVFQKCIG